MSGAPIGVFDSGVGGLTVLRALLEELPEERFVYLGDTARLPYGTKSPDTVVRYGLRAAEALAGLGVKCIVIACNTASAVGLDAIARSVAGTPVVGVIEPGARAACAATRTGHVAVVATEATIRDGAYQRAIRQMRPDARVTARPAQLLVALAEEGLNDGPIAVSVARHYLEPVFGGGDARDERPPDTLVLGCTHFPALYPAIRAAVGPEVGIVDSAATTARAVRESLERSRLLARRGGGAVRFFATDAPERFARVGGRFLGREIAPEQVELIDL